MLNNLIQKWRAWWRMMFPVMPPPRKPFNISELHNFERVARYERMHRDSKH